MSKTRLPTQMSRSMAISFAREVMQTGKLPPMPDTFIPGGKWEKSYWKFQEFLNDGIPRWTIFPKGNSKLPFHHFGTMMILTCPGAGTGPEGCVNWCYTLKSIRYPETFFRLLQNTILIMRQDQAILDAWMKLPGKSTVRLYVDGDFDSLDTLIFFMDACKLRGDLTVYGYSKSWALFLEYDQKFGNWPTNYFLNLSSGSIYGEAIKQRMLKLPICRGEFVALPTPEPMPLKDHDPISWARWAKALKEIGRKHGYEKSFICPGRCGTCTPKGHACGSRQFQDIPVLIGIH